MDPKENQKKEPEQEHGENWVTKLYDKANISVDSLNKAAIGLIVLIFALVLFLGK